MNDTKLTPKQADELEALLANASPDLRAALTKVADTAEHTVGTDFLGAPMTDDSVLVVSVGLGPLASPLPHLRHPDDARLLTLRPPAILTGAEHTLLLESHARRLAGRRHVAPKVPPLLQRWEEQHTPWRFIGPAPLAWLDAHEHFKVMGLVDDPSPRARIQREINGHRRAYLAALIVKDPYLGCAMARHERFRASRLAASQWRPSMVVDELGEAHEEPLSELEAFMADEARQELNRRGTTYAIVRSMVVAKLTKLHGDLT